MALIDNYNAAQDGRVKDQVIAAIYQIAANVYGEVNTTTGHTQRAAFATKIANGLIPLDPLVLSACAFASLNATSSDTTVTNAVSALWNMWAGV